MAGKKKDKKYNLRANERDAISVQNKLALNPTVILFLFVFVFLIICIIRLATRETTGYYEVVTGNNGKASSYDVFVARDETLVKADRTGFVNYLVNTGERVRVDQPVLTIDENGDFTQNFLSSYSQDHAMDELALSKTKNAIRSFALSFDVDNYSSIYDEKTKLNNQVMSYLTDEIITNISSATDEFTFNVSTTKSGGIFTTTYDGYESFNPDKFNKEDLKTDGYELYRLKSTQEIKRGEPAYKLITKDSFTIIFQMKEEDVVKYWNTTELKVYFPQIDKELKGRFSFTFAQDDPDTRLARIDFDECGYLFADIRITNIQINSSIIDGLKIPDTALTTKDYYVIPKNYLTRGGNSNIEGMKVTNGFNLQVYENGTLSVRFTEIESYKTFEDYILVDTSIFNIGDIIIEIDTGSTYEVGAQKSLQGVYNVNKGYAMFRVVNLLDDMENGFVIVEKGYPGSISPYDHIALNANLIKEGELIY